MSDIARLKESTDMLRLFETYGERPRKGGGEYYYVLCPDPEHNDRVADDCFFKEGGHFAYCAACAKSFSPIDVIMLKRGCDFREAADILWRFNGCPDWYKSEGRKDSFFVSNSDLAFLGIRVGKCRLPRGEAGKRLFSQREIPSKDMIPENGKYLIYGMSEAGRWETYLAVSRVKALVRKGCLKKDAELSELEDMLPGFRNTDTCREQRERLDRIRRCVNG